jgi:hypothetical protein
MHDIAYEDTEHYAITRDFLNHYPRRLQQLLEDDEYDRASSAPPVRSLSYAGAARPTGKDRPRMSKGAP